MEEIKKIFDNGFSSFNRHKVFGEAMELLSITIANACCFDQEREDRYLSVIKNYDSKQIILFTEILAIIVDELTNKPRDVMGELYMTLELGSKNTGQFFTPAHVCELMAGIAFNKDKVNQDIASNGYTSLNEPSCGASGMVIAFSEIMRTNGFNPQTQLKILCEDLDVTAVYMSYVQLSLLGLNAEISHKNTLTQECWGTWHTPQNVLRFSHV